MLFWQNLFFLVRVEAQAEPLGYEVQWLLHNHPSGISTQTGDRL